mmetsp:Transcript_23213/g.38435  ORF Transcript_23213/g.38435 Transcript_23213/m.38435 type:complete len:379 (-) Transcript_23213:311-1447(-)|eukprot:CAMPEP_0119017410 /NCGR_PEP_ID=MMETSP1176-20130426/16465_1 /TAXON_ID=265551 /ORGANISM="Synedropsis recta cf, Strain CCMP1620" /LENGTH=378 /DNA_ID=CAMNT_0006971125 /DNA_START=290 /DNA_END=1426 /DNA_ORIENTATION=+
MISAKNSRHFFFLDGVLGILFLLSISSVQALSSSSSSSSTSIRTSTTPSVAQNLLDRVRCNDCAGTAETRVFQVGNNKQPMGHVLPGMAELLAQYPSVFDVTETAVTLMDQLEWQELSHDTRVFCRSRVVQEVLESLRDEVPALAGWRDEPFAVRQDFYSPPELIIERAAGVLFGAPAYGVFLNGYTCESIENDDNNNNNNKPTHVWIGRRSSTKATWPGRLDSLAAGGLAAGMLPREAIIQECQEEAGIGCTGASTSNQEQLLLQKIQAVSAVSYTGYNEDKWGLKRDVLFCFDLQLPTDFKPIPVDGEMECFEKMSIPTVLELLQQPICEEDDSDNDWKPNVGVVLIDFLVRHGCIDADDVAFLPLVDSLRGAKCA